MTAALVLGPLLRYTGETAATIWVQTDEAATVTVSVAGREYAARTFAVHGHHYALVVIEGLPAGSRKTYTVSLDGEQVWPERGSAFPDSRIPLLARGRPTRLAFGSCRTSAPHDEEGNRRHGVDALRAYAIHMLETAGDGGEACDRRSGRHDPWPDIVLFLGDQIYADETPEAMREFIADRRGLEEPPGEEIKDFVEYAELYRLAWSSPENRWLLSTLPSAMIFDDHDVRDDWNTSWDWHRRMRTVPWWHERIVGALSSYWVYQHIGNLAPDELAEDELWRVVAAHAASDQDEELDLTAALEALAERADEQPESYRWSFARDLGDCRLVMVDSRAARVLEPGRRSMLDDEEMEWLDSRLRGDTAHLFIGTSLPFLLPPGLHDFEAWSEVTAQRAYGHRLGNAAERLRQAIDLEHWAAFNDGFERVFEMVMEVARGERGEAPATVTFLSGDVHNSYVAEVDSPDRYGSRSRIVQAVCSPIRNPMPIPIRIVMSLFARGLAGPMRFVAGRSRRVPDPRYPWTVSNGPWFDNNLAICDIDGPRLRLRWLTGSVEHGDLDHPATTVVAEVRI